MFFVIDLKADNFNYNLGNPVIKSSKGFYLKLKISITSEPIRFSILGKLHIGPVMVFGGFIFRFKSWGGFKLFLAPLCPSESLDARGVTTSFNYSN